MNSFERVSAAIQHQPTDRVPIFMWFHPETAARLARLLEISPVQVGDAMGNDVHQTWVNNNAAMEGVVHEHDGESHVDEWGIQWVRNYGFNQIGRYPLAGCSSDQVLDFKFPYKEFHRLFLAMDRLSAHKNQYFMGCDVSPCVFEMYWRLRGMEQTLLDMVENQALAEEMFARCASFAIAQAEEAFHRYTLDWLWTGDDVASQTNLMFSPGAWRRLVKPNLAGVFNVGKTHGVPVAYHSCGAIRPIIPDLVEMGMDVLNPVQVNCPGMDIFELKREFGQQITFMGGLDTQVLLPSGSVAEVRQAVRRLLDQVASGGGYILAASHTIPPETPDENIFALYAEAGVTREEIFDRAGRLRKQTGAA